MGELRKAHKDWGAWAARKFNKRKSLIVPAAELENLDLETELPIWSCFYRASESSITSFPSSAEPALTQ
jgi:hypothetical protein